MDIQTILVFFIPNVLTLFWQGHPNIGVECKWGRAVGTSGDHRRYSWLSMDDVLDLWTTNATIQRAVYRTDGDTSVKLYLLVCSMHDHNEEKRTEQNLFVRSGKSEAEIALDVLYYWS